jgi:hypothetical protein
VSACFGFSQVAKRVEDLAVRELGLAPLPLAPQLSALAGEFRGRPARLSARAYAGRRHAYARFVDLAGDGLEIANVVIVPRPSLPLPVLGIDLVGLGKERAVVVADLSPMTDSAAQRTLERDIVARHRATRLAPELALQLPTWAAAWFSESAVCTRVLPNESVAACQAVAEMADAFVQLSRLDPTAAQVDAGVAGQTRDEVARRQRAYFAAHRADDRGLLLLRRIFEPEVADRFLREVLFPERIPA